MFTVYVYVPIITVYVVNLHGKYYGYKRFLIILWMKDFGRPFQELIDRLVVIDSDAKVHSLFNFEQSHVFGLRSVLHGYSHILLTS